jgi:hypothetical protein
MAAMLRRAAPTVGGASDAHRLRLGDEATDHPTIEPNKLDMFWQEQARCCASNSTRWTHRLALSWVYESGHDETMIDASRSRAPESRPMELQLVLILIVILAGLAALGAASLAWGVDSRDPLPDDHRR